MADDKKEDLFRGIRFAIPGRTEPDELIESGTSYWYAPAGFTEKVRINYQKEFEDQEKENGTSN